MKEILDFIKSSTILRIIAWFFVGFLALQFIAMIVALIVACSMLTHVL